MNADCRAVLDACVLIPMPLADTLLRMAEEPRLFRPMWSQAILDEVSRNLVAKWGLSEDKACRREREIRKHFPEASVEGFDALIESMLNEPEDRHVLAAAVHSRSEVIVTYNLRHFAPESMPGWRVAVLGPSAFLRDLYALAPSLFVDKLREQAEVIGVSLEHLLWSLSKNVPAFVDHFRQVQERVGSQ